MADTTFVDQQTIIEADWANDVNALVYTIFQGASTPTEAAVALPDATEQDKGMLSAANKIKLDNFRVIEVVQEGGSLTLELNDNYRLLQVQSGTTTIITIPTNAIEPFAVGSFVFLQQTGPEPLTVEPAFGVTLNIPAGKSASSAGLNATIGVIKVNTNEWTLVGNLAGA
jgi:hypothetical protein